MEKVVQEVQVGFWVRRRAGDTHAASQVTPVSKARELGGTPQQELEMMELRAQGIHWSWAHRWGGGAGWVLDPVEKPLISWPLCILRV